MDDVMLKREAATKFFERDRRDLNHECYSECCNWEEVREHYEHDTDAAVRTFCFVCFMHYTTLWWTNKGSRGLILIFSTGKILEEIRKLEREEWLYIRKN